MQHVKSTVFFIIILTVIAQNQGGGAAKDRGGSGVQRDGREGAELAHLHLQDHPRSKPCG